MKRQNLSSKNLCQGLSYSGGNMKLNTERLAHYLKDFLRQYPRPNKVQLKNFVDEFTWALTGSLTEKQRHHLFEDIVYGLSQTNLLTELCGTADSEEAFKYLNAPKKRLQKMLDTYNNILHALERSESKTAKDKMIVDKLKTLCRQIDAE